MYDPLDINDLLELPMSNRQRKRIKRENNKKNRQQSRGSKKPQQQQDESTIRNGGLSLKEIHPKTDRQSDIFDAYEDGFNLLTIGSAGTGKSFLACYLAIRELINNKNFEKILIVRSVVSTRDVGFLPGKLEEKIAVYEAPYAEIFSKLFGRGDAYDVLKRKGLVEFVSTSFVRGVTFDNTIVIADEIQNMNFGELSTIITRLADNTRVMFCGDFRQSDLKFKDERQGLFDFVSVLSEMPSFVTVNMTYDDIVRGATVKSFIIKATEKGLM